MNGYPPGTKVVVWASPDNPCVRTGDIATVGSCVQPPGHVYWSVVEGRRKTSRYAAQELVDVKPLQGKRYIHRIDYLRPLEDPDTQLTEQREEQVNA